ncbi:MAG TPA: 1-acyl-sn-glycerol-3-phosphate acyltransferase [Candidatus Limnocylindrales bacterium]|nr:1-acyl-sn-glycerol-3-phosphate acyltransferase [Candidatus Limnocylindrales bacterium]
MIPRMDAAVSGIPAGEEARPRSATVSDIFLARLGALEKRVGIELERSAPSLGPAGEYALHVARLGWRAASSLAAGATTAAGRRELFAAWTAGGPVDELGFDAGLAESVREIVKPLSRRWLGLHEAGSSAFPERGGVLLLVNRSAWPIPIEALVLWAWLGDGRLAGRRLAVLWDADFPELPYLSDFFRRIGLVAATRENASALLERGAVVLAFPEGVAARTKTYDRRYRLARFDSHGLFAAALESGARIVPGAVLGNEDSYPLLGSFGLIPLTAQFPLLGPAGILPLPVTWTIRLGPALEYGGERQDASATDAIMDAVRARMQACIGELLAVRSSR